MLNAVPFDVTNSAEFFLKFVSAPCSVAACTKRMLCLNVGTNRAFCNSASCLLPFESVRVIQTSPLPYAILINLLPSASSMECFSGSNLGFIYTKYDLSFITCVVASQSTSNAFVL